MDDVCLAARMARVGPSWTVARLRYGMAGPAVFRVSELIQLDVPSLAQQENEERAAARAMSSLQGKLRPHSAAAGQAPRVRRAGRGRLRGGQGRGGRGRGRKSSSTLRAADVEEQDLEVEPDELLPDPAAMEAAESMPLPAYDKQTGRVTNAAGFYIGAIRHTRVGEPGHMVCVYCSFHKCSRVFQVKKNPSEEGLLRWLANGKHKGSKFDHLQDINAFAFGDDA
eukprot:9874239-Lingulodinium_polyedra.AAC.1